MTLNDLRNFAVTNSLFPPTTLQNAMDQLGFIQADPIRSPARAQDLILRHRVRNYKVGDLDKNYNKLKLDEDFLYAYGFFSPKIAPLLHPKNKKRLSPLEKNLLAFVKQKGKVHPRDLDAEFGKNTKRNWWGGSSKATKMALDQLHYYGFLRVSGRKNGIRTYQISKDPALVLPDLERAQKLALTIISILQPVTEVTFRQSLNYLRYFFFEREKYTAKFLIDILLKDGLIVREKVDGVFYLWKADFESTETAPDSVKILAPFDPVVWDRARFEHIWGWPYRFEAYTPAEKRIRGYYAMPLLWQNNVIGWVNAKVVKGTLETEPGFISKKPREKTFEDAYQHELKSFKKFLQIGFYK